jgi:phosphoglycerate kinase
VTSDGRMFSGEDIADEVVVVRSDFNVPLATDADGGVRITDDGRIQASLPTLRALREAGARIVVLAHLGRPKGQPQQSLSLSVVARRLAELLGGTVEFVPAVTGREVAAAVEALNPGGVLVAENVRFDPRETSKDPSDREALAREWAEWADRYVSDGFGVVHREQASVTELARLLPSSAGLLVDAERAAFARVLESPDRPYVVVLGGSKVSDKLGVIEHLLDRVDRLVIGGGMAFTFLRAQGLDVGRSLVEESMIDTVAAILDRAERQGVQVLLPVDVVIAPEITPDARATVVDVGAIPSDEMGLDIGPRTITAFVAALADARTIVWNGPMGVFEMPAFAEGTRAIASALAESAAYTVVGGGDSAAAVRLLGIDPQRLDHISTGGGASLELLEGRVLPGLAVLAESTPKGVSS